MIALLKKLVHRILVLLHLKKEVAAVVAPVVAAEAEVKKDV